MASFGHIAIGMAAGRLHTRRGAPLRTLAPAMAGYALLSALPDADIIGYFAGVPYDSTFGHRGAVHSLTFGVLSASAFCGIARLLGQPLRRTAPLALVAALSHPLLDTLTDGGHAIALLWPFSDARFFAPVRPIPVAPLSPAAWMSPWGARVVAGELLLFGPLLAYALWPRFIRPRSRSRPRSRPRSQPRAPSPERRPASAPGAPRTPPPAPTSSRASGAG